MGGGVSLSLFFSRSFLTMVSVTNRTSGRNIMLPLVRGVSPLMSSTLLTVNLPSGCFLNTRSRPPSVFNTCPSVIRSCRTFPRMKWLVRTFSVNSGTENG
uniref:Secreted protein n=1 Tax=Cacopsylla melanoneura TaxID=428564 RepID=A0A8D8LDG0_9HEMI